MRWANLSYKPRGQVNLGDQMQLIAIDYLYERMGINDIKYINMHDLRSYDEEYVVLPITMALTDYVEGGWAGRLSERIRPVFVGLNMVRDKLSAEEVNFFKRYSPIGCRDERTLRTMRSYGVNAYLNGCITITLPHKAEALMGKRPYIVDVAPNASNLIPADIKEKAVYRTHMIDACLNDVKRAALEQYNEYVDHAELIITSLLHCAVPCMAAGIPVVLIRDTVSYRFGWLEKLIPIYTSGDAGAIDWNPKPFNDEPHKDRVFGVFEKQLRKAFHENKDYLDLSDYYENRSRKEYVVDVTGGIIPFIEDNWKDKNAGYEYAVWGITQSAEYLIDYIEEHYPNARCKHVYDSFRTMEFKGLQTTLPDEMQQDTSETVFVTAVGAVNSAWRFFKSIHRSDDTYALIVPPTIESEIV